MDTGNGIMAIGKVPVAATVSIYNALAPKFW
jgi:hypothetical protein